VYNSREAASNETKTALQFHFRYVKNWRQTCATRTQSNPMRKICVAFCVNVVAHLLKVATSVYISREAASKKTKTALQFHFRYVKNWRQTCATQVPCNPGKTLPRVLRKCCRPLFYVATSVYISREVASKETTTALHFHFCYVKNWCQTCATRTQSNPMGKTCVAFCVNVVAHLF